MEDKNIKKFSIVMHVIEFLVTVVLIKNNPKDKGILLISSFILLMILYGVGVRLVNKRKNNQKYILKILELLIIYFIISLDATGLSIILILVQVGELIIKAATEVGVLFTLANYITYIIIIRLNNEALNLYNIVVVTIDFTFTYVLTVAVRHEIIEKGKAQLISNELETKTRELERAYERLQELYEEKEEVIILKERNRIAGEIHDTVGHILTTVIIQLEASKRLIKKDSDLALEKLDLAQQQVKTGLRDIRKSVRALKDGEQLMNFIDLLKAFMEEVQKNSEVIIRYRLSELPEITSKAENVIYRALQEGITNGIRHGGSKSFEFTLDYDNNMIKFMLKDEGKGFEELKLGFGLYNMKSKVEEVGGIFTIKSSINKGVTIFIEIPILEGQ